MDDALHAKFVAHLKSKAFAKRGCPSCGGMNFEADGPVCSQLWVPNGPARGTFDPSGGVAMMLATCTACGLVSAFNLPYVMAEAGTPARRPHLTLVRSEAPAGPGA